MADGVAAEGLYFLQGLSGEEKFQLRPKRDRLWGTNDSALDHYCDNVDLLNHSEGVAAIIQQQLAGTEGNAGIDIAGGTNGVALQNLLSMGLLEKALVTNYEDRRSLATRLRLGWFGPLKHVKGHILDTRTWSQIADWQQQVAPEGVALVMHRPDGGMQYLPPDFYKGAVHRLLDMIRPEGVMFAQVPHGLRDRHFSSLGGICKSVATRPDVDWVDSSKISVGPDETNRVGNCVVIVKN
ncbi:MAG TPA: hypothetical protein VMU97_02150 [Candidatus Dormibacteraeota bacterium]|nr:hypothetical protein [Candidatus Dormibacteraeota bacterium]